MAADPGAISHILHTTNLAAAMGLLTATATAWIVLGKPDLGMTINGCLAGLVAITAPCAFVSVGSSVIIGGAAGILVVFAVLFFDKVKIDDPVGALAVHLANGVFGTLCVGLFAQDKITGVATGNGLFFGGGFTLLGLLKPSGSASVILFTLVSVLSLLGRHQGDARPARQPRRRDRRPGYRRTRNGSLCRLPDYSVGLYVRRFGRN